VIGLRVGSCPHAGAHDLSIGQDDFHAAVHLEVIAIGRARYTAASKSLRAAAKSVPLTPGGSLIFAPCHLVAILVHSGTLLSKRVPPGIHPATDAPRDR
jgi:hypothetical protein